MEGPRLGRYRILSKLAEGGMGAVYLATHELMGREVVIKLLLPQFSMERDIIERFFNEARVMGNLAHPGIVAIFDLDFADDGRAYIVMERLQGESLHQRLRRVQRMYVEHAVDVGRQLASALAAAHGKGVVHRDLKPANVFLCPDPEVPGRERVKVLDFGVAKLAQQQSALVTRAGAVVGTPGYMAPEQCRDSSAVDHRADLYALGCILYACLCGRPPFVGEAIEVLAAQLRDAPAPPRALDPSLPPWLDELVMRLLEKDPDHRLRSCAQVVEALDHGARLGWPIGTAGTGAGMAPVPPQADPAYAPSQPGGRDLAMQPTATQGPASTTFSMASGAAGLRHGSGSRRWTGIGIGAVTTLLLGAGLYLGLASSGEEPTVLHAPEIVSPSGPEPGSPTPAAGAPAAGGEAGSAEEAGAAGSVPPASEGAVDAVQALLDEARAALASKDWEIAASKAREALEHAPEDALAQQIVRVAETEQEHASVYRALERALKRRDFDEAESRLPELPPSSVYHELGKAKLARARGTYEADLQRAKAQAETWRDAGKCDDIRALQAAWSELGGELAAMMEQCREAREKAAAEEKAAAARAAAAAASASPRPKPEPPPVRSRFDELLAQSRAALKQGSSAKAHDLCKQALAIQPREPGAVDVCAVAACNLRKAAQARGYYAMASADSQTKIHRYCLAKGIVLAR